MKRRWDGKSRKVREIMTPQPVCCLPSDSVHKAAGIMKDLDTGVVPVVDGSHGRLGGIVPDRDLCLSVLAAEAKPPALLVQECMAPRVVVCGPEDDVEKAMRLLEDQQIRRLPVVDAQGVIVGIVSMTDIIRRSSLEARRAHGALEKICEPTPEASKPRAEAAHMAGASHR